MQSKEIFAVYVSKNKSIVYCIYSEKAHIENNHFKTYGLLASSLDNSSYMVNDVYIDINKITELAENLCEFSICPSELKEYIINYISCN